MFNLFFAIIVRIFSNSSLNVFQKILTSKGEKPSVINFYTYLGLTIIGLLLIHNIFLSVELLKSFIIMGLLGALGNYFIIKALSLGDLSTLAPINSYKPIVALVFGVFLLNEIPNSREVFGVFLILLGTIFLSKYKILYNKATFYRVLALIFSGSEAIFIKKIILLSDVHTSFFLWALASLFFTTIFVIFSKHKIVIKKENIGFQTLLILLVALMQFSTNYVFSKMNVAYALALFQLSTVVSVFLGVNIFHEKGLVRKLIASFIMLIGASIICLA